MTPADMMPEPELSLEGLAAVGARNDCDREPIHLSGAIQAQGCLLAVDAASLVVLAASRNIATTMGCDTDPLGRPLAAVLGEPVERLVRSLHATSNPHDSLPERVEVPGAGRAFDMVVHAQDQALVLEFEEATDVDPTELAQHFHRHRDAGKVLLRLDSVDDICRLTAQEVRRVTGYDRVMVYRFEPDAHGYVIAEERREDLQPFLGLHYPASDIPRQARALYLRNWIRVIEDVEYTPVSIEALPGGLPGDQLDLSLSVLRSVSPAHLQYLRTMGVAATMTISLIVDDRLWGMIACHHGSPMRVDHSKRVSCESLGHLVSVRLRAATRAAYDERVREVLKMASQVIAAMAAGETPALGAAAAPEALLGMTAADGAVVEIDGIRTTAGSVPGDDLLDRLVPRLAALAAGSRPFVTEALGEHLPDGDREAIAATGLATGALYLPLPGRVRGSVLWLRGERTQTLRWAGRPPEDADGPPSGPDGHQAMSPRASFDEWLQQVRGRSLPWDATALAGATELAQAMPEVVEHRAQNRLVRMALHDPLTGLPNRTLLQDRLDELMRSSPATAGDHCGLLFVDIDEFKSVNDTHGHHIGDELLVSTAQRISAAVRSGDTVARLGGDEFVVLLPETDALEASRVGHRVVESLRQPVVLGGSLQTSISASVGVAVVPVGTSPSEALRQADAAMYHAKKAGRDQAAVYDFSLGAVTSRQELARDELLRALDSGQIVVHYQPVYDLAQEQPVLAGFEALARWQHPTRGVIPPDMFIKLAEETGLIASLGRTVLLQSLREARSWTDERLHVGVNVSVLELVRPQFAEDVLATLVELGVEPHRLTLEVTESQMMSQPELALAALAALDAAGVRLAIDDFGTGFSSMAYLRDLPAGVLKIDRLFMSGLPHQPKDAAVVEAIIRLSHSLGMRTVAEGVETPEQLAFLRRVGSDYAQGYLLGVPTPAEQLGAHAPVLSASVGGVLV